MYVVAAIVHVAAADVVGVVVVATAGVDVAVAAHDVSVVAATAAAVDVAVAAGDVTAAVDATAVVYGNDVGNAADVVDVLAAFVVVTAAVVPPVDCTATSLSCRQHSQVCRVWLGGH